MRLDGDKGIPGTQQHNQANFLSTSSLPLVDGNLALSLAHQPRCIDPDLQLKPRLHQILNHAALGSTHLGVATIFKVLAPKAERIELCLFLQQNDPKPSQVIPLLRINGGAWGHMIGGLEPGQLYNYRVYGEFKPSEGKFFDPTRFLADPYARLVTPSFVRYDPKNIPHPKCIVVKDGDFDWGDDKPPAISNDLKICEVHVKGLTKLHPEIPEEIRGTYAALAHPAMLKYYREQGITTLELMPITAIFTEPRLRLLSSNTQSTDAIPLNSGPINSSMQRSNRELVNYWGYNPLSFFAPELTYAAAQDPLEARHELKSAIKQLHTAGIEVILDVVLNHTAEAAYNPDLPESVQVPNLSMRGFDGGYYLADENGISINHTGCGNSLNMNSPMAKNLAIDSLRYWVTEFHVDGFRFDAAPVLGRTNGRFRTGAFFEELQRDPILGKVKLIAEPWDMGPEDDRYHQGNFPKGVMEWNGFYRDVVRRFWRGDNGVLRELASAIYGSSHFFQPKGRSAADSINAVSLHDGLTLRDLTEYERKHNAANAENNMDGVDHNHSHNHGHEGATSDPEILTARRQTLRNLLTTLFVSSGTPMIVAGDERGRTQRGNNNAYCQDNSDSWVNWDSKFEIPGLKEFTAGLARIRAAHPVLQQIGYRGNVRGLVDYTWINPQGEVMNAVDWKDDAKKVTGVCFSPHVVPELMESGRAYAPVFVIFNAHDHPVPFVLPRMPDQEDHGYEIMIDTSYEQNPFELCEPLASGEQLTVPPRSVLVFQIRPREEDGKF